MKKITILFLSAIAIAATYPLFAAQDFGFSDPILIVRDDTDSQRPYETSAVRMYFFNHPISQGNGNFSNSLKIPGKRVGDVVAVPGSKIDGWSSGMLAFLPQRNGSQLTSRVGMGPRGFKATGEQTTGITRNFNLNLSERVNESGRGLILADVRKARESEYGEGITNPYIGDGACGIGDSPYCSSPNTYISPAMIRDPDLNFKVCSKFNNDGAYFDCEDKDTILEIDDVISYDLVTGLLGNNIVAPSFDSLQLKLGPNRAERGYDVACCSASSELCSIENLAAYAANSQDMNVSFTSPNVFYSLNKDKKLYNLLGYSSILDLETKLGTETQSITCPGVTELPGLASAVFGAANATVYSSPSTEAETDLLAESIKDRYFTNPIFPIASNPVASKMLDSNNFAVLYYNTLFSWDDYILNPYGRPAIFRDWKAHKLEELIGPKPSGTFTPFTGWDDFSDYYPSKVVVPVIFWNMSVDSIDTSEYEKSNPSSISTPSFAALIDYGESTHPGIFNMEVLKDKDKDKDKSYILIPSSKKKNGNDTKLQSVLYVVDPADNSMDLYMKSWYHDSGSSNYGSRAPKIYEMKPREVITKLPFRTPSKRIVFDPPLDGFVPYQIATGNLDGDECEDVVVTYRSGTFTETGNYGEFGVTFPNHFTIIFRKKHGGACGFSEEYIDVMHRALPASGAAVSAVAIGNFLGYLEKGKARNDIAVGNLNLEDGTEEGKTGYVYIFANSENDSGKQNNLPQFSGFPYDPDTGNGVLKVRAGFKEHHPGAPPPSYSGVPASYYGVGYLTTDRIDSDTEYDNFGAISGLPLILPSLSCPEDKGDDNNDPTRAVSQHEGMLSVLYSRMSATIGTQLDVSGHTEMKAPFQKFDKPVPQRCAPKENVCKIQHANKNYALPLWVDECSPCSILDHLCDFGYKKLENGFFPEIFSGIGAIWCMYPDEPFAEKVNECWGSSSFHQSSSREDRFAYLTDAGGIADGSHTQDASSFLGGVKFEDEGPHQFLRSFTIQYAPTTIMDNLLTAMHAWQFHLPSSTADAIAPIDTAAAGCSLVANRSTPITPALPNGILKPKMEIPTIVLTPELSKILPQIESLRGLIKERSDQSPSGSSPHVTHVEGGETGPSLSGGSSDRRVANDPLNYKIPLIKGREMPGPREMTVILGGTHCGNGILETGYGEKCDWAISTPQCTDTEAGQTGTCHPDCLCSVCGDGIKDDGEECDDGNKNDDSTSDACRTNCKRPTCGDGVVDSGEECEGDETKPGYRCNSIKCMWISNTCMDGVFSPESEECDSTAKDGECKGTGFECSQGCTCEPVCGDNIRAGTEFCDGIEGCPSGYTCNEDCSACEKEPVCGDGTIDYGETCGEPGLSCPEGYECIAPAQLNACTCTPASVAVDGIYSSSSDCEVKCMSFMDEGEKLYYDLLNETYFRTPSGRKDDFFCPKNSVIQVSCIVEDAALNGSVGPWMMVQSKGMLLHDMSKITSSDFPFDLVAPRSPIRVAPLPSPSGSAGKASTLLLPNLSSVQGDLEFSADGVPPMAATSVMESTAGIMTINNMIEHRAVALMPSTSKSQSKEAVNGAAATPAVHYTKLRTYPEPTHTTIESWPKDLDPQKLYVENRLKPDYVRSIIETRKKEGAKGTRDIAMGVSDDLGIYEMSILQETYGKNSGETTALSYSFYSGPVSSISEGGAGCGKCSISENSGFNARAAAPILLAVLLSALALGVVRVRVSVRPKRK